MMDEKPCSGFLVLKDILYKCNTKLIWRGATRFRFSHPLRLHLRPR